MSWDMSGLASMTVWRQLVNCASLMSARAMTEIGDGSGPGFGGTLTVISSGVSGGD